MIQVLLEPVADLERKLAFIRDFIQEGCRDTQILALARRILADAGPTQVTVRDPWTVATALYAWVQSQIPFERDPITGEVADLGGRRVAGPVDMIQNAAATLARGSGDCVALTILLGSLACTSGLHTRVGLQDIEGGGIDHVLLVVGFPADYPTQWLPLDLTADGPGELRPGFGGLEFVEVT